jgi:hypothetical protein
LQAFFDAAPNVFVDSESKMLYNSVVPPLCGEIESYESLLERKL